MKIDSDKYTGRNQLINRLSSQVGSRKLAIDILVSRGHLTSDGKLTDLGEMRNRMTAEERAIDRAIKDSKYSASDYVYNPFTNKVKLKK